jgi:hypothetical protein
LTRLFETPPASGDFINEQTFLRVCGRVILVQFGAHESEACGVV